MAQHYYTATVQIVVAVQENDPSAAKAAISGLLDAGQENAGQKPNPLINWAYLKVGGQSLTPTAIAYGGDMTIEMYEDSYLARQVNTIIALQKQGKIVLAGYEDGTGLPTIRDIGKLERTSYPHDFTVGDNLGYLDYTGGHYIFIPNPGKRLPKVLEEYKTLRLGVARIDTATRTATIQVEDTRITFTGVQPWNALYKQVQEINQELTRINTGVVVWKAELIPDQSGKKRLYANGVPSAMNGQARLDVTGYAYDPDRNLAYLGVVGYKTGIESLRATLLQNKLVTLNIPNEGTAMLRPLGKYEQVWQAMPEFTSHHSTFVSHLALPGKWEAGDSILYLLAFLGTEDIWAELKRQFAARLNEALEIPIQPEWTEALWELGVKNQHIRKLETGGDCLAGVRVNLEAQWMETIDQMLKDEILSI